jgi:predicted enzyme related to lactoylglutathione lyase
MALFEKHAPGTFCYAELVTSDPQAGGAFYQEIFGWDRRDDDMGEHGVYTQFLKNGQVTAAMYKLMPEQVAQGLPPMWGQYISVDDADATATRAAELGGALMMGPMDVRDLGRMAVLRDPSGAVFNIWQPGSHCGVGLREEPGAMCWNELLTRDPAAAAAFYAELVGWTIKTEEFVGQPYTLGFVGDDHAAGLLAMPDGVPAEVPAHWLVYFEVTDCEGTVAQVKKRGGQPLVAPTDLPNVGRFTVMQDPQGAVFAVIQSAPKDC